MAAPTSEYICPYDIFSRKNGDQSNVRDLTLDRDAAISAAITFDVDFQKYDVIASCGYKNYCQKLIIDEDATIFHKL